MYKVGDKVKVKKELTRGKLYGGVYFSHLMEEHKGNDFVISRVRKRADNKVVYLLEGIKKGWDWSSDMLIEIEKVEESKEMTFPEMVQKLIDGEFEVGTELVCDDTSYFVGHATSYFVDHATVNGYGLKSSINTSIVSVDIGASKMNKNWKVKEQPIKEMSMEELQKELGYRIKIVE